MPMESGASRPPPERRQTQRGSIGRLRFSVAEDEKSESLETEVEQILEEDRMVLPGI